MHDPIALTCKHCGAPLHPTVDARTVRCAYCGIEHALADAGPAARDGAGSGVPSTDARVTTAPRRTLASGLIDTHVPHVPIERDVTFAYPAERRPRRPSPWRRRDTLVLGWLFLVPGTLWTALAFHDGVQPSMKLISVGILGFAISRLVAHGPSIGEDAARHDEDNDAPR